LQNKSKHTTETKAAQLYVNPLTAWIYSKLPTKPVSLLITLILLIFIVETIVMLLLSMLNTQSLIVEAIIDSFLLVFLLYPLLLLLIVRPLQFQISIKEKEEEKLIATYEDFEESVNKRTSEHIKAIEQLKLEIIELKKIEQEDRRRVDELEEFYSMSVRRELKMQELKNEIENQKSQIKELESELLKYKK
jgi:hypothetical protein